MHLCGAQDGAQEPPSTPSMPLGAQSRPWAATGRPGAEAIPSRFQHSKDHPPASVALGAEIVSVHGADPGNCCASIKLMGAVTRHCERATGLPWHRRLARFVCSSAHGLDRRGDLPSKRKNSVTQVTNFAAQWVMIFDQMNDQTLTAGMCFAYSTRGSLEMSRKGSSSGSSLFGVISSGSVMIKKRPLWALT